VSQTGELYLGVIAFAVVIMALIQVGAIVAGVLLAKRVQQLTKEIEQDIKPLLASLTGLTSEAARAAALAAKQVERIDQVFGDIASRVDQTLSMAQNFVSGPARQGLAILSGVKAMTDALRGIREASRRRQASRQSTVDDEESLFIG
jgi:predicted PurR-regulated permease PerM